VATWGGFLWVAFLVDVFARRIIGLHKTEPIGNAPPAEFDIRYFGQRSESAMSA